MVLRPQCRYVRGPCPGRPAFGTLTSRRETGMTETLQVEEGRRPWQPGPDAQVVKVLDRFDVPTVGFLEENGHMFVFRCLDGHAEEISVWMYAPVMGELKLPQVGGYDDALDEVFAASPVVTFALADIHRGITRVANKVDVHGWRSPLAAAASALELSLGELDAMGIDQTELTS